MTPNEENLKRAMLPLSRSTRWPDAKLEWAIDYIEWLDRDDPPRRCTCEHFPIRELCFMKNLYTDKRALVGNVCVAKFLGIDSLNIFSGLERIQNERAAAVNAALADYAFDKWLISDWEYRFLVDNRRRRRLTERQEAKRLQINDKILAKLGHRIRRVNEDDGRQPESIGDVAARVVADMKKPWNTPEG